MPTSSPSVLEPTWAGLVDDAAIFPPGNAPLAEAMDAFETRAEQWYAGLVGSFVVSDTALPGVDRALPLSVVSTGGAGSIPGALRMAHKRAHPLVALEVALQDPADAAGNARRVCAAVDAARDEQLLDDDTTVYVELPASCSPAGWLAAADEVAAAGLRLKFRTGGTDATAFPSARFLAGWIDAALDRETAFKCTAGLHRAVRHRDRDTRFEHHGFLNVLVAVRHAFDGASPDDVTAILEQQDQAELVSLASHTELSGARRWFRSFGSCSVDEPLEDLVGTGLLEER
jgi:hypothetical protein